MRNRQDISGYLKDIARVYSTGKATEHSYRAALKDLLAASEASLTVINEPKRIDVGAPDYIVERETVPIGFVEAKDVEVDLDQLDARSQKQLNSYKAALPNLILTNYLEFRWYVGGDEIDRAVLGDVYRGKLRLEAPAIDDVASLLTRFTQVTTLTIRSPQQLSQKMAGMAKQIAYLIRKSLTSAEPSLSLQTQMQAFERTLIPNLTVQDFADMYAQTLAYGLFAARVSYTGEVTGFSWKNAFWNIPKTNPFLRKMFQEIASDMDDRVVWLVETLSTLLAHADMKAILEDFGRSTRQEDPVVHFYETFLAAYNPQERQRRGVYYTPEPVVSYIVHSVGQLLKERFGRPAGLADTNTMLLDPATGTGTFLYFIIREIYDALESQRGTWDTYVRKHLLPRIFGFELLMAPYAVAHMKLGIELKETGYKFSDEGRLGVYLTNTLEETARSSDVLFAQFIAEEAEAAAEIKRDKPIMVVLGNPPYSYESANTGKWIKDLVRDYYQVDGTQLDERNPKGLQDDYVKFIRFGQWRIEQSGSGILAFVTNHGYLNNPTFRGMRQQLLNCFTDIYILNLHGNSRIQEACPDGSSDQNVFDIQAGVSIGIFVKDADRTGDGKIHYHDVWGLRAAKYEWLLDHEIKNTDWQEVYPQSPFYLFVPQNRALADEYEEGWSVKQIFPVNVVGIVTGQDSKTVAVTLREGHALADAHKLPNETVKPVLYRPFDNRFLVYHNSVIDRMRTDVMNHMLLGDNLALVTSRVTKGETFKHVQVTINLVEKICMSPKTSNNGFVFPLYLYSKMEDTLFSLADDSSWPLSGKGRRPNLSPLFVQKLTDKLGIQFVTEGKGDLQRTFGPEDVLHYAYALFHSPTYRERYADFLGIDFPRLPLTSDIDVFQKLVKIGSALVDLYLMRSTEAGSLMTTYPVRGNNEVASGYPQYTASDQRVWINQEQYFEGVPEEVWEFHVGGYQVPSKWLKDRRGRQLSFDEVLYYQHIVVALAETIRLMGEIDRAIPEWPIR